MFPGINGVWDRGSLEDGTWEFYNRAATKD